MKESTLFVQVSLVLCILTMACLSQQCADYHYFNGQRCAPCKENCKCSSDNTCDTCLSGYAFDARFQNCLQCPLTAGDGINVGCKQCCTQIIGTSFVCSQCEDLPYIFMRGGQCIKMQGCLNLLQNGVCTSCLSTFYLHEGKCVPCDASCQICRDHTLCLTCKLAYFNSTNVDNALCTACPTGCKVCTSLTSCSSCSIGYYQSGANCLACAANCLSCTATVCTQCNPLSTLISGVCYLCTDGSKSGTAGCVTCQTESNQISCKKCLPTYYLNVLGLCTPCSVTFSNSYLCSSSGPIQCINDYHLTLASRYHLVNGQCIANTKLCKKMSNTAGDCLQCYFQVIDNYYKLSNNQCIKCQQIGCQKYSQTCQCLQCQNGYRYVNNLCLPCQNLHCIKCQADVQSCQKCALTYGIFSSACISCSKTNCLNCDGDYMHCKLCQDGYYLSDGSCYLCQTNCLLCQSNTKCTLCTNGYYLQSNGRCKVKPFHCMQVDARSLADDVAVCKKCQYGYQIQLGNCYPCSQSLYNLNKCEKYCPSYYALHSYERNILLATLSLALITISIIFL